MSGAVTLLDKFRKAIGREAGENLRITDPAETVRGAAIQNVEGIASLRAKFEAIQAARLAAKQQQQNQVATTNSVTTNQNGSEKVESTPAPAVIQQEQPAMGHAVNLDFLKEVEGFETKAYVPNFGKSGVTVASGFDLGQHSAAEIKELLPPELAGKLVPYAGLQLDKAKEALKANPLNLSKEEAEQVNKFVKSAKIKKVAEEFDAESNVKFESLPAEWQTAIASVAFQYGSLKKATPTFWKQVTTGDWEGAYKNLLDFKDDYGPRRKKEAELVSGLIGGSVNS